MIKGEKLSFKYWLSIVLLGLVGQFAWTIENMYLNVFLYQTVSASADAIAAMVAASAIVATLTTLLMGALSDRIGKRRSFIVVGYLLWGVSTASFGFLSVENIGALFPIASATTITLVAIITLDCIMTFFGSLANDAAFNAYVTETTDSSNRGRVEAVLVTLPLVSMLIIFGLFDGMTKAGNWTLFFLIFGALVFLSGIAAIFLLPKEKAVRKQTSYFKSIVYGFRFSVMRENKLLYVCFLAFFVFHTAVQIFFPYLIIYVQEYLKFDNYAIVLGVVLLVASLISVIFGKWMDKVGKLNVALPSVLLMSVGLWGMFFARSAVGVIIMGILMMGGYMLINAALGGAIRDYTPKDKVGHFQGVRMLFQVLLPMVIGPSIGAAVIRNSESGVYVELGVLKQVPIPGIFLAAALCLLPIVLPLVYIKRKEKRDR